MLKKLSVVLAFLALTLICASSFADGDLISYGKVGVDGIKKGAIGIYDHALRPLPGWIKKAALGAKDGTIFVVTKLDAGGRKVVTAVYKAGDATFTHVLDPVGETAVQAAVAIVEIPTRDLVYKMILVPGEKFIQGSGTDLATGAQALGSSEKTGAQYLGSDIKADALTTKDNTEKVYEVTLVPVMKGAKKASQAIYHATIRIICGPQGCSAQ